jgi:hypothetical protein
MNQSFLSFPGSNIYCMLTKEGEVAPTSLPQALSDLKTSLKETVTRMIVFWDGVPCSLIEVD